MGRQAPRITQEEVTRAIRAAKRAGAAEIEVRVGDQASIVIRLVATGQPGETVATSEEIVL
jgi:hypothetical protein